MLTYLNYSAGSERYDLTIQAFATTLCAVW